LSNKIQPNPTSLIQFKSEAKSTVHFLNKGRRKGRIPCGRSSRRGNGLRVAERPDRRWRRKLERDEERKRMREE
jgi:hypothetical protein